jgi:hypothetical protein
MNKNVDLYRLVKVGEELLPLLRQFHFVLHQKIDSKQNDSSPKTLKVLHSSSPREEKAGTSHLEGATHRQKCRFSRLVKVGEDISKVSILFFIISDAFDCFWRFICLCIYLKVKMSKMALLHSSSPVNKKLINSPHIWDFLTEKIIKPIYGGEKDYEFFTANICIGVCSGWLVGSMERTGRGNHARTGWRLR